MFRAEVPPIPQSANGVRPHKPSSGMWKSSPHLHPTLSVWDGEIASETPGATVQIVKCVWQGGEGEGGVGVGGGEVRALLGRSTREDQRREQGGQDRKEAAGWGWGGGGSAVTSYSQPFTGQKPGGMVVMKTGQAPGIIQWNVKKLSSPALHSPPQDTVTPKIFHTKTVQSTPPAPHSPPQDTKDNLNQDNAVHTTCTAQSSTGHSDTKDIIYQDGTVHTTCTAQSSMGHSDTKDILHQDSTVHIQMPG